MAWDSPATTGDGPNHVLTTDELVVHLREAGAKCVYDARPAAFRDGTVPITATYEYDDESGDDPKSKTIREMLTSVFDAVGDRIWFHDQEWGLEWTVEPAFADPQLDRIPIYDRRVERKHGNGFNLGNLFFVYEEYRE